MSWEQHFSSQCLKKSTFPPASQSSSYLWCCSLAGVSRSVTVTAAYLMTVTTLGWREALNAIRGARNVANPNFGFQRQLQTYESEHLEEVSTLFDLTLCHSLDGWSAYGSSKSTLIPSCGEQMFISAVDYSHWNLWKSGTVGLWRKSFFLFYKSLKYQEGTEDKTNGCKHIHTNTDVHAYIHIHSHTCTSRHNCWNKYVAFYFS